MQRGRVFPQEAVTVDLYADLERMLNLAQLARDDPGSYHSDAAIRDLAETVCALAAERDTRPTEQAHRDAMATIAVSEELRRIALVQAEAAGDRYLDMQREAIRLSAENRGLRLGPSLGP